ncbi:Aldolase [Glarea lozoyensis ATCC 20868]|uniref:Aldolase n=1 Tax=Glarea lozoyensis (strain ATCC 20868 / MF5171) TaxID=1116229 RepID=S3CVM3_GLAL2|nr:Aldolase [Glarea lozoyensis ATCC 20868]EPE30462.1 Aldolase [Glarea lozoyensis ATCC 20868]
MLANPPPPGIYVPIPTFFLSRSSPSYSSLSTPLDPSTQSKHSLHLARSGVTGLVVLGSTGEAVHLSTSERSEVLSNLRKTFDENGFPNYPLIAGTASQNINEVLEQLRDAERVGVRWGLVLVPGYFAGASTQEGIIAWFRGVADASPIPVMIYHYPGVSNNVKVTPQTIATLSQHPNIVGCKLSHGDVSVHAQIASSPYIDHEHFHTFTGLGQQLLPVLSVGCAGAIDGAAGFFPKSVVRLYELGKKDSVSEEEKKERRLLQYKVSCVEEIVVKYGTVGIKECVSRVLGMGDRDGTRVPLMGGIPGGDKEWENWRGMVEDLEGVEKGL